MPWCKLIQGVLGRTGVAHEREECARLVCRLGQFECLWLCRLYNVVADRLGSQKELRQEHIYPSVHPFRWLHRGIVQVPYSLAFPSLFPACFDRVPGLAPCLWR